MRTLSSLRRLLWYCLRLSRRSTESLPGFETAADSFTSVPGHPAGWACLMLLNVRRRLAYAPIWSRQLSREVMKRVIVRLKLPKTTQPLLKRICAPADLQKVTRWSALRHRAARHIQSAPQSLRDAVALSRLLSLVHLVLCLLARLRLVLSP